MGLHLLLEVSRKLLSSSFAFAFSGRSFLGGSFCSGSFSSGSGGGSFGLGLSSSLGGGSSGSGFFSSFLSSFFVSLDLGYSLGMGSANGSFLVGLDFSYYGSVVGLFLRYPLSEDSVNLLLSLSTFVHTYLQVLLEHGAGLRQQHASSVGRLGTVEQPLNSGVYVDGDESGSEVRVVSTQFLDETTVTRRASVSYYYVVNRLVLLTSSLESDFYCHFLQLFLEEHVLRVI